MQERRRRGGEVRQIRADIGQSLGPQGKEVALKIGRQFNRRLVVATMRVRQERFRAIRDPFHRTVQPLCRRQHGGFLAVVIDFGAKTAANIRRDHGQFVFRNPHHKRRNQQAREVRVLTGGIKFIVPGAAVIIPDRATGFHRVGHQTVVDQCQLGHMRGRFERRIHRRAVILDPAPVKTDVVFNFVMHAVAGIRHGLRHVHHGGQFGDVGLDRRRRIAGLFQRFGHDHRIGVADMAHLTMGQNRALGFLHRLATARLDQPARRIAAHASEILAGHHRQHARHAFSHGRVDAVDAPMRDLGPQETGIALPAQVDIGGIPPFAGQKPDVFAPLGAGADATVFGHSHPPLM